MFGNVKVNYNPCKSKVAVERTAHYILGKLPQQIKDGVIKTAPNLYWGINCDRDNFPRDVMMTRKLFGKRNSGNANLSYQISISFSPEDRDKLTDEEVFRIAKDFAEKFFQGYEVLFAVHIDKPHPHAHFLIGNCHTETGKAFRRNERDLYNMCEYLGEQCQKRGLTHSMREEYYNHDLDDSPDKETLAEKQMKAKGKETFKDELREVIRIECADPNNKTLEDVVNALMKHYHVECRVKGNTISYRHPNYTDKSGKLVSVRGSKLGDKYTVKGINYELGKNQRGREQMIKEAERIHREYEQSRKAQRQGAAVMESQKPHKQETPLPELNAIETRVREMAEEIGVSSVDAQRDERVLLLVTATLKMCQLLKNYSTDISAEIQRLSEHQMQNLSLQEQYAKSVRTEVADSVYNIYHQVKMQEKEAINELMQYVQANSDQMEKDITACAGKVKSATEAAEKASIQISKSVKRFCTVRTIGDLLYYAAPVAVVIDVLLRLFDFI